MKGVTSRRAGRPGRKSLHHKGLRQSSPLRSQDIINATKHRHKSCIIVTPRYLYKKPEAARVLAPTASGSTQQRKGLRYEIENHRFRFADVGIPRGSQDSVEVRFETLLRLCVMLDISLHSVERFPSGNRETIALRQ